MTESPIDMKNKKYLYGITLLVILYGAYINSSLLEEAIIDNIVNLKNYYIKSPVVFSVLFFLAYIILTTMSLPVALVLGLLSGFIFEVYIAIILISFSSSIGATLAMIISRYFIREYVQKKFKNEITIMNNELSKHGAYYLFALRMSPIFPFFIINIAFGLTKMRALTFYFVSQIGMLPASCIIILIGSELDKTIINGSPFTYEIILYLTLFGVLPFVFKKYIRNN